MQVMGSKKIAKNAAFLGASNGIVKKSKKSVFGACFEIERDEGWIDLEMV
jgi:hypothetical protein